MFDYVDFSFFVFCLFCLIMIPAFIFKENTAQRAVLGK
jgi:hypothetical protein